MTILLRESKTSDFSFLREMLYEAVFWRKHDNTPSLEEGLAYPDVSKSLEEWKRRDGDTAVVAMIDSILVGAAWYRYWTESNNIRGYVNETTPSLVIGVHRDYRHQGIGTKLMQQLIDRALQDSIRSLSLAVSKDNHALELYLQQGFREHEDMGDSILMVREIAA